MVSLVRSFGITVVDDRKTFYPADGGFRTEIVATRCFGDPITVDDWQRLEGFFTPATERKIGEWIVELSVISARRTDDDMSETIRLHAYTRRLSNYPADVVRSVLFDHPWKFFPTWAELYERLEPAMKYRRSLHLSAQNVLPKEPAKVIKLPVYDDPPKERGPLPFVPEPSAPVANVAHLKEELKELEADKALFQSEHGQAYAQSLIQRIAEIEGPKSVNTNTTRERLT